MLALVGIPLGLSSKKGGKSTGLFSTIVLVFAYYSASLYWCSLWLGKAECPPHFWRLAVIHSVFLGGALPLWQAERRPFEIASAKAWLASSSGRGERRLARLRWHLRGKAFLTEPPLGSDSSAFSFRLCSHYVLSEFTVLSWDDLSTFLILLLVFTLFELLGDILRNQISPLIVGEYLLNYPLLLYQITHIAMLLAVLYHVRIDATLKRNHGDESNRYEHLSGSRACFAFGIHGRSRIVFL